MRLSGIGPERAYLAAKALLDNGATALLSWGSAGGLDPRLAAGSLVLPKEVIGADHSAYQTDAAWHVRLCIRLKGHIDFHTGPLSESPVVLATWTEKADLFRRSGAIAVDMESAAVARAAQEAPVPFLVVRAIADSADMAIPAGALRAIGPHGGLHLSRLLQGASRHPSQLIELVRLGRAFHAAQVTLAGVASLAGTTLLAP